MKSMQNNLIKIYINIYAAFLIMYMLFGRSFSGIQLFSFKIGELLVGFCLLFVILFFPYSKYKTFTQKFIFNYKIFILSKAFILSFILSLIFNSGSFFNLYSYRSSSIIWTINFIFLGYFLFNILDEDSYLFKLLPSIPIIVYILSTVHFPEILIKFFNDYSDKFDFVKGSDLLLTFVVTTLFVRNKYKDSLFGFTYFLSISSLFVPLFIYKSKGAFFPGLLFIIFNIFYYRNFIFTNKLKSTLVLLLCIPVFLVSTFNSYGNLTFKKMGMDQYSQEENIASAVPDALSTILSEKNTPEIFASFFIMDGRLYSQEQMANWRLQIWQDTVRDLFWNARYYQDEITYGLVRDQGGLRNDLTYLFGFGYNEILPSMNHWERQGTDGSNQNPHNFLIYALGRGGFLLGFLVILFNISLIVFWYKKHKNFLILLYILPILFAASFDAALESVRYPLIYFSFYAYFIKNNIEKVNKNN